YRMSSDGGTTWRTLTVPLPANHTIEAIDFWANRSAGVAAVAVRATDQDSGNGQDLVYKLNIKKSAPFLTRRYDVGLGDVGAVAGVGNDVRFDFESVAIFPD